MKFCAFFIQGRDAGKFLQGQLTVNVDKISDDFLPCAICNLKGRVQFGLWVHRVRADEFCVVLVDDLADEFAAHIKKYGAFSKMTVSQPTLVYPAWTNDAPSFTLDEQYSTDMHSWQAGSIACGNYWIDVHNTALFQPQELRLHQRGGVDYDKGCYLGQEIVARLYFKASPKAYLHRVRVHDFAEKVQLVNQYGDEALVVARPDDIAKEYILSLPAALQAPVARVD